MRTLLALLLLLATPAFAAEWGHYVNPRFGYAIEVPTAFVGQGEADNGDGQVFTTPTARLTVSGGYIIEGSFEDAVTQAEGDATDAGWNLSYQVSTPSYATYSGSRGGRILYARMIALCGEAYAAFWLEYSKADLAAFDPVVSRLVRTLRATEGSAACP